MDPWIDEVTTKRMKSPNDVERWQPIIDMQRRLDEMGELRGRCEPIHLHVAAELGIHERWFHVARDGASVGAMRWLDRRIEVTIRWARAVLAGAPCRCKAHDEPLALIVCEVCRDVSGVGCGYGCGAERACERCWEQAPTSIRSARKPGYPDAPGVERYRRGGPACWGCGAHGVPLVAGCGYPSGGDDDWRCPRAVCKHCHLRRVPCNACEPYFPFAPRPVFTR